MGPWRTAVYQVSHFSSNCPWSGFNLKCITVWGPLRTTPFRSPPSFSFFLQLSVNREIIPAWLCPLHVKGIGKGTAGNFLATLNLLSELHSPFPRQTGWRCTPWGVCVWRSGQTLLEKNACTHTLTLPQCIIYLKKEQGRTKWMTLELHYVPVLLCAEWLFSNAPNWS